MAQNVLIQEYITKSFLFLPAKNYIKYFHGTT